MLFLQGVTYYHPNKDLLFQDIHFAVERRSKIALIGNNGAGKSTLLRLMAGELQPSGGRIRAEGKSFYVAQLYDRFNGLTVAGVLGIAEKLKALNEILAGNVTGANLELLDDDWEMEDRCRQAFRAWNLDGLRLDQPMDTLSGGEKTKVFLAGIAICRPDIVLLDEPSNHLDAASRTLLYEYIRSTTDALVVVSHDRTLLNLLPVVCELSKRGIAVYGGNYDLYAEQKRIESDAREQELKGREKELRKAKVTARESLERQQKLDARGKAKQEKAGLPTIAMKTFRNNAEKSTARMQDVHTEKMAALARDLDQLRKELPDPGKMKINFDDSSLHTGKVLITAADINFAYGGKAIWREALTFQIRSGERVAIKGDNGVGKTTLINGILGNLQPANGHIDRAGMSAVYVDQQYSLIDNQLTVLEQVQQDNSGALQDHEIKIRLTRFLFSKEDWDKPCAVLSGGEKMRLILCALTVRHQAPDLIVLDEPTNNLDIQNLGILTAAVNDYQGTILVVSHDAIFLEEIGIGREMVLDMGSDSAADPDMGSD
ncbi:ribosomal protection-like ABC-F family protein [Puia sp.]|jgi:ATPase subunit of ABC transporter with duplicated ATPase domains|uniref:ribosomal protection-like ABC-F family protein n=1 Tax=Puia sp. TaxID=2045100 RepID=UPI002F42CBDD